jgi:transmembrane sensor
MTEEASDDDMRFEQALDLIIRLQNDPASPVTRELIRRWRARGPDYEAAWVEAAEIHGMAGKVLVERRASAGGEGGVVSRRGLLLGGGALVVAAGTGALVAPGLLLRARADHVTSTAELRRVPLADGSIATLGPDSAVRSAFTPERRDAELLAGMAFFEIVPDPARPFRVVVDGFVASALGTAFEVIRDAGGVTVSVNEGVVQASVPGSPRARDETLAAGEWLTLDETTNGFERGARDADQIAAWRDGLIVADREAVASVVAKIARWQAGRVVIADRRLGAQRISGVFDLTNPLSALQAVIQPHGGRVRQFSPWLTVISSV